MALCALTFLKFRRVGIFWSTRAGPGVEAHSVHTSSSQGFPPSSLFPLHPVQGLAYTGDSVVDLTCLCWCPHA